MMNHYFGYLLIFIYGTMLTALVLWIRKRQTGEKQTILSYLFAGKNIPGWLLTTSVFSAWVWVTTIIGSAEAAVRYGISGVIGYSVGASFSFFVFTLLILAMRALMPESTNFLEFIGERYSSRVKTLYYVFALLTTIYVAIEQAAGIGFVLNGLFDASYKKMAFLPVLMAIAFVILTGMRGILYNEFVNFFIIFIGFAVLIVVAFGHFEVNQLLEGLLDVHENPHNVNYHPDILNLASRAGLRYSAMAVIIAFGQIFFDPAYYVKASLARSRKEARKAFLIGGILLWCPLCMASAVTLGGLSIANAIDFSDSLNMSADIPTKLIDLFLGKPMALLFAFFILSIGVTTILHYLIGIQAIFTLDFYAEKINPAAGEKEKLRFGKGVTILVGFFCGLIAISLEGISLLTIDMFCGVFFAAPCSALIFSVLSKKDLRHLPIFSVALGLCGGFYVWVFPIADREWAWFCGTMTSFFLPAVFLFLCHLFVKQEYNFVRLRFWRR